MCHTWGESNHNTHTHTFRVKPMVAVLLVYSLVFQILCVTSLFEKMERIVRNEAETRRIFGSMMETVGDNL